MTQPATTTGSYPWPHSWDARYLAVLEDRLWSRVDKRPGQGPKGECWEWRGTTTPAGYGLIGVRGKTKGGNPLAQYTHRLAFQFVKGMLPPDRPHVLHSCDNPPCCRPDHLFAGTPKMNTYDSMLKGRHKGGRPARPKAVKELPGVRVRLTPEQGALIRRRRESRGLALAEVASQIGLDVTHYSRFERGVPDRTAYLEQLYGLIAYLGIGLEELGALDTFQVPEPYTDALRKKSGGAFKPHLRFTDTIGRFTDSARFESFKRMPPPDLTFYRADLIRHFLKRKGAPFRTVESEAHVSTWTLRKILLGENVRRESVMKVASYVGLRESEVFNTREAKAA